jgi:hypothetical protein
MILCANCGFTPEPGKDWGYVDSPVTWDTCEHIDCQRYCTSCSDHWWQPGLTSDYDYDLVDGEYKGGCGHQDCPDCVAWAASPEGIEELARQKLARSVRA